MVDHRLIRMQMASMVRFKSRDRLKNIAPFRIHQQDKVLSMLKYPVYIHQSLDGSASGFFADVPGCVFAGETLSECLLDARSALSAHFALLEESGLALPEATSVAHHLNDPDCQGGVWCVVSL